MNFFEYQDEARRKTGRLVLLFCLAVVAITISVYLVFAAVLVAGTKPEGEEVVAQDFWNPQLFLATVAGVGAVIAAGSFYRIATLGTGGKQVAESLGGRLLGSTTNDWRERRLLNVVEEMALASGMPVPAVYVMDNETVVNAFAAGFTPADAVVAVTRGTMETLTRDELQGVIAHEFSHIFNGDMRLNLRLIGILHGILLISTIGYLMFRIAIEARPRQSSSSSGDKKDSSGGIVLAIIAIGIALYVLGYIGVFFGHLIKSAVSRQREFLADASAVQFTRHPQGISGALKKIGALGSRLTNSHAEQASHMFFGNGVKESWFSWTATHPPLIQRIQRIEPTFDGDFSKERLTWPNETNEGASDAAPATPARASAGPPPLPMVAPLVQAAAMGFAPVSAQAALADIGAPTADHLEFAGAILNDLPSELNAEVHDPIGAAATIYAMLLHADPSDDEPELQKLAQSTDRAIVDRVRNDLVLLDKLPAEARLPLAQLSMTALRQLTPPQFEQFRRAVVQLIRADKKVSLFEYALHRMILKHLVRFFDPRPPTRVRLKQPSEAGGPTAVVLSALAHAGNPDDLQAAAAAYNAGRQIYAEAMKSAPLSPDACGYSAIDAALDALDASAGVVKQRVLNACAACIAADGKMTIDEMELLRTVADALDCPMPPPVARTA